MGWGESVHLGEGVIRALSAAASTLEVLFATHPRLVTQLANKLISVETQGTILPPPSEISYGRVTFSLVLTR